VSRALHIYLSGGMEFAPGHGGDWRADLERLLTARKGWSVFNPVRESERFLAEHYPGVVLRELKHADPERFRTIVAEIVRRDSAEVAERADALLCLWDESAARGAGTQGEITLAARRGTPVLLVTALPFAEIPGWVIGCSTHLCRSFDEALHLLGDLA
jgi:hypothetical protein